MERKQRRRFTADFETATWLDDESYVWCWAVSEIGNENNVEHGTKIEEFISWCEINSDTIIYFHNLKFDGSFILSYLLNNGFRCTNGEENKCSRTFKTLITDMGIFFSIEIWFTTKKHIKIYDSLKLIPGKIEDMPKDFGIDLEKLEIDYNQVRGMEYIPDENEIAYILNDVKIPAIALNGLFERQLTKMTIASNALSDFKNSIGYRSFKHFFPVLTGEIDQEIRSSYRGGFTYLNDIYKDVKIGSGVVLDVNSLYPSVLYCCRLPIGEPKFFTGKYKDDKIYDLYVQRISCEFELKKGKIPTIQIKGDPSFRPNEYLKSSQNQEVVLTLTNVDLDLFFENYHVYKPKYLNGFKFRSARGIFKPYIDKWTNLKIESKKNHNKSLYQISKLMLNSLYGKFGLNPSCRSKTPYLKDGIVKYKMGERETREGIYIPIAAFVTAYARDKTIRTSQKIRDYSVNKYGEDKYIYSDTDSIHTTLSDSELKSICDIDDYRLGAWKIESKFCRAKFIRQKTYVEEIDGKLKITCAGLPENCYSQVTFENFNENLSVGGKLSYKHVKGGVKLVETTFKIKNSGLAHFRW